MSVGAPRLTSIGGPTKEVGPAALTLTAADAMTAARALGDALVIPLRFEGWVRFSESRDDLDQAFAVAGLSERLRWTVPGQPLSLPSG